MHLQNHSFYLVVELSDVLLYVWQQPSEGELLNELSDVVMVIQGQTCPVAPCSSCKTLWISCPFFQFSFYSTKGVQAPRATCYVQLERMAFQAARHSIW